MPTTILDGETYEQARHRRFTEEAKVIEKIQQDEIIRMAREVDAITGLIGRWIFLDAAHLERFADLVAAHEREKFLKKLDGVSEKVIYETIKEAVLAEREACAKVCDDIGGGMSHPYIANNCAAAIRSRCSHGASNN